jgi:hypothetical protein
MEKKIIRTKTISCASTTRIWSGIGLLVCRSYGEICEPADYFQNLSTWYSVRHAVILVCTAGWIHAPSKVEKTPKGQTIDPSQTLWLLAQTK